MNGSNYSDHLTADVTSYDYDALLTEDGQITDKYRRFQKVISQFSKEETLIREKEPSSERVAYGSCTVAQKVDLFHALDCLSEPVKRSAPNQWSSWGRAMAICCILPCFIRRGSCGVCGFTKRRIVRLLLRMGSGFSPRWTGELLERHEIEPPAAGNIRLDILMENMGRVNYGPHDKLAA